MIGYIEGKIIKRNQDRVLILANQIGYEVQLPSIVMDTLDETPSESTVALYIYYHQTERQPKPTLIGFNSESEKEFFQLFISVEAIGPLKAAKALNLPISEIAYAIEAKDENKLSRLKGIGKRTAQKIIATLAGKVSKYAHTQDFDRPVQIASDRDQLELIEKVLDVLVHQLGHRPTEARDLINKALKNNMDIRTPEELLDEIYRVENE